MLPPALFGLGTLASVVYALQLTLAEIDQLVLLKVQVLVQVELIAIHRVAKRAEWNFPVAVLHADEVGLRAVTGHAVVAAVFAFIGIEFYDGRFVDGRAFKTGYRVVIVKPNLKILYRLFTGRLWRWRLGF